MHSVMWLSYWYMVNISIPMPQENYSTNEIIIAGYLSPASFTWINKQTVALWKTNTEDKRKDSETLIW